MNLKFRLLAVAAAAVLASCGGGVDTAAVRVVGDSLADNGTFGFKFTVQGTATAPHYIWSELVTSAVAAPALCSRYAATGPSTVVLNQQLRNAPAMASVAAASIPWAPQATVRHSRSFSK
jgi:outer membrane lipase/esterase